MTLKRLARSVLLVGILCVRPLTVLRAEATGELLRARAELLSLAQDRTAAAREHRQMPLADIQERLATLEIVVNRGILATLSPGHADARSIEEALRTTLSLDEPNPSLASAVSIPAGGKRYMVVVYALTGAVTTSRSWLGVYEEKESGGPYRLMVSADNPLPDSTVALSRVEGPPGNGFFFFLYGTQWGDAHNRMTVVAYKFSGDKLRRIWSRQALPQGRLEAVGNKITLTYLTRLVPPWEERTDIYAVGLSGVMLERTRRKPNP